MQPGRRRLFIYYRVDVARAQGALAAVGRMQAALCARHAGLRAELLRRPGSTDSEVTVMETYTLDAPSGIGERLQAEIEAAAAQALAGWLSGARHVEVFEPCA
jgi:hypothetical protein